MSGRKNTLLSYKIITNGVMTGTSVLTSTVTNIQHWDNVCLQFVWAGSPTGTFSVQFSVDYAQDFQGNVTNTGTWDPITLSPAPAASGSAGSWLLDLNQLSMPWVRVVYTNASGSGVLQAYISGKEI